MKRLSTLLLLAAAWTAGAQVLPPGPLPEVKQSKIGYPTVAAALAALRAKPGVTIREVNGWTVAEDRSGKSLAVWTFTPGSHPAHPSVVKRTTLEKDGHFWLDMGVLCQAAKEPCDALVREFQAANERIKASMQPGASSTSPRDPEVEAFAAAWLDLLEQGKSEESFALLTDIFKANLTPETWRASVLDSKRQLGALKSRKLRRIVWYQDPQNTPLPGTYVAVEFDSEYENADKHFRFVILHSLKGEPFKVMRNESTVALKQKPATPDGR